MRIEGSGALVVGGASGLGEATARALAARGARVTVADVNADRGLAVAEGLGAQFARCDVRESDQVLVRRPPSGKAQRALLAELERLAQAGKGPRCVNSATA